MKKYFNSRNRAIISELVRADFKVRYQNSVLGYAWSLLRPLLLFAVLYIIFTYVIPLGKDVEHYPVYLLTGVILWNFFTEATTQGLISVVARGDVMRKINIPRYLLVISTAFSASINMALSLVVLFIFAFINGILPSLNWLLLIPLMAELFALCVGISLLLSSLYVKFRDISYIWEVVLQIGFYANAIIFPLALVSEHLRKWFFLSPVVQIIQDARYLIATKTSATLWSVNSPIYMKIIPFLAIILFIILGIIVFKKRSRTFAEDI